MATTPLNVDAALEMAICVPLPFLLSPCYVRSSLLETRRDYARNVERERRKNSADALTNSETKMALDFLEAEG